jgi:hypothetical protein
MVTSRKTSKTHFDPFWNNSFRARHWRGQPGAAIPIGAALIGANVLPSFRKDAQRARSHPGNNKAPQCEALRIIDISIACVVGGAGIEPATLAV